MDIQIPAELQWVSYLAGGAWPQGSESRMFRIMEHCAAAANDLQDLIPDLNAVRNETLSVLSGETAEAADQQFAKLFDGDYTVEKLAKGVSALGGGAQDLGSQIQYSKLSIIVGLALAAAEIAYCLANAAPTAGVSTAAIPGIEAATTAGIRGIIGRTLLRIDMKLTEMLGDTMIKQLAFHAPIEAMQELAQGLAQEVIVQGIQVAAGTGHWQPQLFVQNGVASFVGGAAGGATSVPVGRWLGAANSKLGRAAKGMTTNFTAGISGNIAGTAVVGGEFDPLAMIASSAGSSIGGIRGAQLHGEHQNNTSEGEQTDLPQGDEEGLSGDRPPEQSEDELSDESSDDSQRADSHTDDSDTDEAGQRQAAPSVNGASHSQQGPAAARVSNSSTSDAPPAAAKHSNNTAAQSDPETARTQDDTDDDTQDTAPAKHRRDEVAPLAHPPDTPRPSDVHTADEPNGHHPTPSEPIDEQTPPPAENGQAPVAHTPNDSSQETVDRAAAAPTDTPPVADPAAAAGASPVAPTAGPSPVHSNPAPNPVPAASNPETHSPHTLNRTPAAAAPKTPVAVDVSASQKPSASTARVSGAETPAARVQDTPAAKAKPSDQQSPAEQTPAARTTADDQPGPPQVRPARSDSGPRTPAEVDCANRVAQALSRRYGRPVDLVPYSTAEGAPAHALYESFRARAEFASHRKVARMLRKMGSGSSAIVTSSWAGGHGRGGHAYLAVNDGGRIYLDDVFTGQRSGWPPHWGRDAVSRTAVGFLRADGTPRHELGNRPRDLAAAIAVGDVQGLPSEGSHHDSGELWRDVTPQRNVADDALARRGVRHAGELRNPLGLMEAASERARDNTTWWHGLTGEEQRALIDIYPHEIGNAEGIPAAARHEANTHALDQQRRELQDWRDRGERLTHFQRKEIARLERIQHALDRATDLAQKAGVGGPQLLAFDSGEFGGSGRAIVSFGEDPYKADLVAWHVPGQGMTVDQLGYCMGDALNHLQSIRAEDSSVSASTIAWIGYDTPSGWNSWRAGGHTLAREGAKVLYSDIRAFNTARDTLAGDGSHFDANHIFAHSYGSTTASYAGRDGRLANDIRTVTLAGSPGVGPLRHAGDFGIGADNVFVASSSRDPFTALGGRRPGSLGRLFGHGLGMDPAMESFGAHRVTAEFSGALDGRRTRYTHNSYFRFEDRGADPPLRSESLANFGRIASGHIDRVDTEGHRTIDEVPRRHLGGTRERTVEPAGDRPLRLDGDVERGRGDRHLLHARWHGDTSEHTDEQHAALDHDDHQPEPVPVDTRPAKVIADEVLRDRGISADELVNPFKNRDSDEAHARACENAAWWAGLTETQREALVRAYPQQVGRAEGVFTEHRDAANRAEFQTYRERADEIQERIDKGEKPSKDDLKFLRRVNKIDLALRKGAEGAARAGVGGPKLLYFDPLEFGNDGRAIVSFGEDPYQAQNVAWLVPGYGTTIDKLHVNMRNALHLLESALREKPTLSASTIAWIGYDAPNDIATSRVTRPTLARAGGEILYSDIRAFNGVRDTWAGDGSHFKGNHIYGHSYGSTTTSHAGRGGRLGEHVRTITLLGSPGVGDLLHANDFKLDEPNKVFVASSSWDPVTAFGGRFPGEKVRILHDRLGLGLGMDPAMQSFGAVRITAEFPVAMNTPQTIGTHTAYYQYVDQGTHPAVRTESLANFGRILAGHHSALDTEEHRTLDESRRRPGTVEPAAGRQLRLDGDAGPAHSGNRDKLFLVNPRWRAGDAGEARRLIDLLSTFKLSDGDDVPADLPIKEIPRTIDPELAQIAHDALALREPETTPKGLVNPLHDPAVAEMRARQNAQWWAGLTDEQRAALVHTHAHEIGNAEGIPAADRDAANRTMVDFFRARASAVQAKITEGEKVSNRDFEFLLRMNKFETALTDANTAAERAGIGHPYLLAYDPPAFGGDGRAVLSFGDDPYTAKSVSWYVPGVGAQMDRLDYCAHAALNILQSTRHENPTLSAASIAWIGYDAPNGRHTLRAARHTLAREGGNILYSDIRAFNAARDTMAGDGSRFSGNHIFGHSYGSTTTSYAGQGGRLGRHVDTITLIGSPGAGPIRHAGAFGLEPGHVYVATSSADRIARLGGLTPNSNGRYLGLGLGTDPAMESFGARRVEAEFLPEMIRKDTSRTHNAYFDYLETDGPRQWLVTPHSPIRTESLANFGRIAAGRTEHLRFEEHRTLDRGGSRVDTAGDRRLHHDDAAVTEPRADDVPPRRLRWFQQPSNVNDCGPRVLAELSRLYPLRRIRLRFDSSPGGVPARHLFLAARSGSRFATYDDVTRELDRLGPGSSALMASRWRGTGGGGHAYLAINTGDGIVLYDPHTGERSAWPPHWGQDAVARTAVGYLKANGKPVDDLNHDRRKLGAADTIGRVRGMPSDDAAVADALAQRDPSVALDELRNPVGSADDAAARARANGAWWSRLSETQQQQLIHAHPEQIGNAEGIPARDRHDANLRVLQDLRERADRIRTRIDEFGRPSASERSFLDRVDRVDLAVRKATADAARAGLEPPMLLALDPSEFGGRGRVVLSFGDDPYHAQKVSWHTAGEPIDRFGTAVGPALDHLHALRQETPSSAAVVWIGDESRSPGALHSDLSAYHAAREVLASGDDHAAFGEVRVHTVVSAAATADNALSVPRGSLVVAHRGASHEFPEQTLAAYQEALRQGADGLECDIRLTKDGQLVCIHDKRIDRTSNGTGRVRDMTLAELRQYDFGSQHPSHEQGNTNGDTRILTLDELLHLVKNHDRPVTLFIEAKEHGGRLERELAALLNRHGLANPASGDQPRVAVISFYPDAIWRLHRAAPEVPTVLLGSAARHLAPYVGASAIGPSIATLRAHPEIVDNAARHGLTTYCWTVNDQNDVQFARDLGVGWIATDHPGRTHDLVHGDPVEPAAQHQTGTSATDSTPDASTQARALADEALTHRIPPVRPDELRNPLGPMEEARARARNNAAWWHGLTEEQRAALIESYPHDIGNAEGIPAAARNEANQRVVQELRDRADHVQSNIDDGARTTRAERALLRRVNRLDLALRKATADALHAGVGEPMLLAFDPAEFGGDGRAVLSFGADPYKADSVSWHVPGVATTVHSLFGFYTECALNHLQSTLAENPSGSVASIAWIGYDTPSGLGLVRAAGHTLARTGGDVLYSDITAFNAARDVIAGDGSHFHGNHIFGYSYGSTTTGYAGQGGRLAGEVTTVSLVGSPGAGPIRRAEEFGIGADHVFVASSSRDVITALGGRTPGSSGRILGIGLGADPAMDHFGAQRIAAEFPPARNTLLTGGTHHAYYLNTDTGSPVRSESLVNLGRIAAGHHDQVTAEPHRTADGRRTAEPAAHRSEQRIWNPRWRPDHRHAPTDSDYSQRQQEYRNEDLGERYVDTRYAQPLGEIVDNPTQQTVDQLARDLSGTYGPHRIRLTGEVVNDEVMLTGRIFHGDTEIGTIQRTFFRDGDGKLVAYHSGLEIKAEFAHLRGQGFSKVLTSELERYYVRSGVDRIGLHTHDLGGFAWARRGFTWDPDPRAMQKSFDAIRSAASRLRHQVGPEARSALDDMVQRLTPDHPRLPEPIEIANLAAPGEPALGRRLLDGLSVRRDGSGLDLVKYMPHEVTQQPEGGFRARLKRLFGLAGPHPEPDCAHQVATKLEAIYYGRKFPVATPRSAMGTPAWALYDAVDCRAEFASYDDVTATLRPGWTAVLTSRWADGRSGGHAYLAIHDGSEIYLYDPRSGERSAWPPHWGQDAVSHTAVGYLDSEGEPVHRLTADAPLQEQLKHADLVGDVKGHPADPNLLREQAHYRGQDPLGREVNTSYADDLGDVIDNASDRTRVQQLAADLTGVYGPYRVEMFRAEVSSEGEVIVGGYIRSGDYEIGFMQYSFYRDAAGDLVAHHDVVEIDDQRYKFKGFSRAVAAQLDPYFARSGVDRIELRTEQDGGDVWARRGFTWNTDPAKLQESLDSVKSAAENLYHWVSDDGKAALRDVVARLDPGHPRLPEPIELATLATADEPDLGRQLMHGTMWHGVKHLRSAPVERVITMSDSDIRVDAEVHGTNCAHLVAHHLWEMYGLELELDPASSSGLPARALFEAVGSSARFTGYDDVTRELTRLGPGSLAILVSQWAGGRQGGHAYLAINVGGEIYLVESHSGRQLGWPPYWGEHAVARTAVGYLDSDGVAVDKLSPDIPLRLQLADADAVGDVRGRPTGDADDTPAEDVPLRLGAGDVAPVPVRELGLPDYSPHTLSDVEATTVFSHGEHRLRELNEQLLRDGMSAEDRARVLYQHRNSLRAWTRDLMSNRTTAEVLAANENTSTFAELVARHEADGLEGDAVFEAIIDTATHSRYTPGTLSGVETSSVYADFEHRLRELNEQLTRDGVSVEERARTMADLRGSLRLWTRELMANRAAAQWLAANENTLGFEELVARKQARGLQGDAVYEDIIDSATHSHYEWGSLSDLDTRAVYTTMELRMREVHEQLVRDGASAEERARTLYDLRASIRTWARWLMADREMAESLDTSDPNPTFEFLVERQRAKGRTGDEIYEAIIASATRSRDSVNKSLGIDPENPPPLPPMRGRTNND
jgi:glycerophosphoryl diester phosphodiesterase